MSRSPYVTILCYIFTVIYKSADLSAVAIACSHLYLTYQCSVDSLRLCRLGLVSCSSCIVVSQYPFSFVAAYLFTLSITMERLAWKG